MLCPPTPSHIPAPEPEPGPSTRSSGQSQLTERRPDDMTDLWAALRKQGSQDARRQLIERHWPLVRHVAHHVAFRLSGRVSLEDLIGAGAEGLIDAVDRFDPERGVSFPAFAAHRIRGAMYDGIRSADWVPRRVRRKEQAIQEARAKLWATLGRTPTDEEEAQALGIPLKTLLAHKAVISKGVVTSLDLHDPGLLTNQDQFQDEPFDRYLEHERHRLVTTAMQRLSVRERTVMAMSFEDGLTLAQIGQQLRLSESRVCQIRANALRRLRTFISSTERSQLHQPQSASSASGMRVHNARNHPYPQSGFRSDPLLALST